MSRRLSQQLISKNKGLDHFTDNEIGKGKAQWWLSLPLYLMLFSEGCQSAVLGILLPKLSQEWDISDSDKENLLSWVLGGVMIGTLLTSLADQVGRYKLILLAALLLSVFGLWSCLCSSFTEFLVVRCFYAIGMGVSLPMSGTYLSQISVSQSRGTILSMFCLLWAVGATASSVLGWVLLRGFHWRLLFFIIAIPGLIALYIHIKFGQQSIRYLLVNQRYSQSAKVANYMRGLNGKEEEVDVERVKQIQIRDKEELSFLQLFSGEHRKTTVTLCCMWMQMEFTYYSVTFLLPTILSKVENATEDWRFLIYTMVSLIEVFSYHSAVALMDHPKLGRRKTVMVFTIVCLIMSFMCNFLDGLFGFILVFGALKLCTEASCMVLFTYTAECFPTVMRAKAMSFITMMGRITTIFIGVLGLSSLNWLGGHGLYIILMFMALLVLILLQSFTKETLGQAMDR